MGVSIIHHKSTGRYTSDDTGNTSSRPSKEVGIHVVGHATKKESSWLLDLSHDILEYLKGEYTEENTSEIITYEYTCK